MRRPIVLVVVVALVLATACGSGQDDAASPPTTASVAAPAPLPPGQDLYAPPDGLRNGPAGSVVWFDEQPSIGAARAWRTLSRSTGSDGAPTWVTGAVYRPTGPAPDGGFPVLVWAHGTAGTADSCAPSRAGATVPAISDLLQAGFVVVAPDGTGLGPPGPAQYLIGASEGHAVLDAARAARQVPGADAGTEAALWGYSSGGQAVLFAAEQADDYAPDLTLLGAAAVAPVSDVARFAGSSAAFPLTFGWAFLTFGAWAPVYDADLSTIFTPAVLDELSLLDDECSTTIAPHFALTPIDELRVADPLTTPPWPDLMAQNESGTEGTDAPVLLVQGANDPIVASESTEALAGRLCDLGVDVELRMVPSEAHDVVLAKAGEVARWLADRAGGAPTAPTCSPQ